ncbi:MAG: hypothetical protein GOMPHAMPRED_002159 [Gomphillus americanus]|uniref:TauD/TfdA-like domain-containing protein n=1 Tax=Gomphillus americanus TaxID=1940652 RepID=A0A8H3FDW2_9LECA|nr:MAG: hypothetical protein GOMPHAMPRED_002159 [Gomphillus americanus]
MASQALTAYSKRQTLQAITRQVKVSFVSRPFRTSTYRTAGRLSNPFVSRSKPSLNYQSLRTYSSVELPQSQAALQGIDPFYLRDSCNCSKCVDVSTRQKRFETSDIPLDLAYKNHKWTPTGQLQISWRNDIPGYENHQSLYEPGFLLNSKSAEQRSQACHNLWTHVPWTKQDIVEKLDSISFDYKDYMNDSETLWQALEHLHTYGLVFIRDAPTEETTSEGVANRIGPMKNTMYGMTWSVKSRPSAKNVAYTSGNLDFHMDLLYLADPPTVQFLHVLKQSTTGGESRFSDAVAAFDRLQKEYPEFVQPLVEFPMTYHYKNDSLNSTNDGHWLQQTRYFLEGGTTGHNKPAGGQHYTYPIDYEAINWSPPFQGPVERANVFAGSNDRATPAFKEYIRAAKKFKELVSAESAVFELKMGEGLCVVFNNRRVLHARKPFSSTAGGERLLVGGYVDGDYLRDKYRYMKEMR